MSARSALTDRRLPRVPRTTRSESHLEGASCAYGAAARKPFSAPAGCQSCSGGRDRVVSRPVCSVRRIRVLLLCAPRGARQHVSHRVRFCSVWCASVGGACRGNWPRYRRGAGCVSWRAGNSSDCAGGRCRYLHWWLAFLRDWPGLGVDRRAFRSAFEQWRCEQLFALVPHHHGVRRGRRRVGAVDRRSSHLSERSAGAAPRTSASALVMLARSGRCDGR